jgi:hypothetical protein
MSYRVMLGSWMEIPISAAISNTTLRVTPAKAPEEIGGV